MKKKYETKCDFCGKTFVRKISQSPAYRQKKWKKKTYKEFCNRICKGKYSNKQEICICEWCGKKIARRKSQLKKSITGHVFCNLSCAASFNNTQKRKSRRSKMEVKLFNLLKTEFPSLEILANNKNILDGYEVDIIFPQINLAIEWNGIVHYKPIYGNDKLNLIQKRDIEKQEIAQKKNIELIVISDLVSTEKYLKEAFLNIKKIINGK